MNLATILVIAVVALVAALIAATFGVGGGTILIIALYSIGLSPVTAIALHAVIQSVSNISRTIAYWSHLKWSALGWALLTAVPAVLLLAPVTANADPALMKIMLGLFVIMVVVIPPKFSSRLPAAAGYMLAGAIAGGFGMVVGATGMLIAPFFLRPGWSRYATIGTLALVQGVAHLLKVAAFLILQQSEMSVVVGWHWCLLLVAPVLGTVIGRRLQDHSTDKIFTKVIKLILVVLAAKLIFDGLAGFH